MHQIYQGLSHVQQTPWEGYTYESKEFVVFGFSGYVYVLTDRPTDGWICRWDNTTVCLPLLVVELVNKMVE